MQRRTLLKAFSALSLFIFTVFVSWQVVMSDSALPTAAPNTGAFVKPSDEVLRKTLTPLQYEVTQEDGTEPPFKNTYWDNKAEGIYVDIVSGEALFSSTDKYKSGTGWPSFTRPINEQIMVIHTDYKLIYPRKELRSRLADSHLGHVFNDGPEPTGKRYCINSAALRFVPRAELDEQGYAQYSYLFESHTDSAEQSASVQ